MFLFILFIYSLTVGPLELSFNDIIKNLFNSSENLYYKVIFETRLPRSISACLTGACLGLSGLILQYITKNPMACPSLLGVNQGAAFGIVVVLSLFPFCPIPVYLLFSFIGGIIASLLTYFITVSIGFTSMRLIIAGQAINALFYALIQSILIFLPTRSGIILINLNGSLSGSSWELLKYISPVLIFCLILFFVHIKRIYILNLGFQTASSLGMNVTKNLRYFLPLVVILSSFSIGLVGPILFFPLIVNHFGKILVGHNPKILAPFVTFFGAILMLSSDIFMRKIYIEKEVAIGLFISILGAPILIFSSKIRKLMIK